MMRNKLLRSLSMPREPERVSGAFFCLRVTRFFDPIAVFAFAKTLRVPSGLCAAAQGISPIDGIFLLSQPIFD